VTAPRLATKGVPTTAAGSIRSRPVHTGLRPRPGSAHLIIADGEGAEAVLDLFGRLGVARAATLATSHLIYTPGPNGTDQSAALMALAAREFHRASDMPALLSHLQQVLHGARMGIQFYLAGTEGLIGQAERDIVATGYPQDAIQREQRGSTVRRVRCVHCKGITEHVAIEPFQCSRCGLHLSVRDHYSRRLAAFQGVCVDAEEPGNIPAAVVRFP